MTTETIAPGVRRRRPVVPPAELAGSIPVMADRRTTAFGAAIDVAIERKGWTLEAAAKRCGVPVPTLSSYKDGRILGRGAHARPTVIKIANGLGIPVEDALEMVGAPSGRADEQTMLGLFRRLSSRDKDLAVELLRTHVNWARSRKH